MKRSKRLKIVFDMDGILADFTSGLCQAFKIPYDVDIYRLVPGLWDYVERLN